MKIPKVGAYFASNVIQAGLQFLLVPLLVRALGPAEYGRWGLLEPVIATLAMVAQFGTNWGILKLVNQDGVPATKALHCLLARGWWLACLIAIAAGGGIWLWRHDFLAALSLPLVVLAEAGLGLVLAAARSENRASTYAAGVLVKFGGITALVAACVFARFPLITSASTLLIWWGCTVFVATVASGAMLFASTGKDKNHSGIEVHAVSIAPAVAYGLPLLGAALLASVLNNLDRFVVERFVQAHTLGAYVVALKIAGSMNFILTPVALWWPTARFKHLRDSDNGQYFFSHSAEQLALLYGSAGALLWAISPILTDWFAPSTEHSSFVSASLCLAIVFRGMEAPLNVGLLKEGKTHWSVVAVAAGAAIQFILCMFTVPKWGISGAACASALSSALNTIFVHIISQRVHFVLFRYMKMALFVLFPFFIVFLFEISNLSSMISFPVVLIVSGLVSGMMGYWNVGKLVKS